MEGTEQPDRPFNNLSALKWLIDEFCLVREHYTTGFEPLKM